MRLMRAPSSLEVAITGKCNLRCLYCFHFTSALDAPRDLPKEEWLSFFEELGRLAVLKLTLEGGEPFIRPDLPEILEGIVKNRMRFNILSNGTLITDEMAGFLASTRRCDSVQISIDGSKAEVHDASRGKGNFHKALVGLEHLKSHGVKVNVRVTINRYNLEDLPEVARFLLEDLGLPGFSTNSAEYMGVCRTHAENIQLTASRPQPGHGPVVGAQGEIPGAHLRHGRSPGRGPGLEQNQAGLPGRPGAGFGPGPPGELRRYPLQVGGPLRRRHRALHHDVPHRIGAHQSG